MDREFYLGTGRFGGGILPGRLWLRARTVWQRPGIGLGLGILALMIAVSFLAPLPYDPVKPDTTAILQPPSRAHWFGTDNLGLDIFSRTVAAAKRDLPLVLVGTGIAAVIGIPLGLLASQKGRWGEPMMRGLDAFQAFPLLVLAIVIVTITGNRLENVVLAIAIINAPRFMRLVRSQALALRESLFVEAARAVGCTRLRIATRHILPNVTDVVFAQCSLAAAHAIIVVAALSFIGVGVSPPEPSWGALIQAGARNMATGQWWPVVFPGLAIFVAIACFNVIADGLEAVYSRVD